MIPIDLTGKTAIVTGGSQGIGESIARRLHQAGANVVINFFPDDGGLNQANAHAIVQELGTKTSAVGADVRDRTAVKKLMDQSVVQFGAIDLVINNAGVIRDKSIKKMTSEQWQEVIDTNLTGVFHVCREAVECIRDGGRIVNLSSISGIIGSFGQANYAAAKAGVIGLTKTLSRELGKRNITVNAIAPGVIDTDMIKTIPDAVLAEMRRQVPLERLGQPDEIADVALFLCSELASYMTGQTIHVNGGWIG